MPAESSKPDHPVEGFVPSRAQWQKLRDAAKIDKGFVSTSIGDLLDAWEVFTESLSLSVKGSANGPAATPGEVVPPPPKDYDKKLAAAVLALNKLAPAMKEYEQKLEPQVQALTNFYSLVKATNVGIGLVAKHVTKTTKFDEAVKKIASGTPRKA
jgi:hypothetical protein